jgi:hypothetical protein
MPTFTFTAPDGTDHSIEGPEGATREQAFQMLRLKLGGQPAQAEEPSRSANDYVASNFPEESLTSDTAKSIGSGLEQGTAAAIGLPGNVASLLHSLAPQSVIDKVKAIPGAKFLYDHLPTSQAVLDSASEPMVDPDYQPQYAGNRYTKAVAANAGPGLATGMGPAATLTSAIAGQGAYDLTGSHAAEAGASLLGALSPGAIKALLARQAMQKLKDAAAIKNIANEGYRDPAIRDTAITPAATQNLAQKMRETLGDERSKFTSDNAPDIHDALDNLERAGSPKAPNLTPQQKLQAEMNWEELPKPTPPAPTTIEDLHLLRKNLGTKAQETKDFKPTEQAVAAGKARRVLDEYLGSVPKEDLAYSKTGSADEAVNALKEANANWRAQSGAQTVGNLIGNAIEDNNAANSAMNLGNRLRQTFKPLLKNDAARLKGMGHGDDVIDAVRTVTKGDPLTNALRYGSNVLGGGGGIAGTIIGHGIASGAGGAAGYQEGGLPGMIGGTLLGMVPGQALRVMANRRTLAAAQRVQDALLEKAPANANVLAANRAARAANSAAMKNATINQAARTAPIVQHRINKKKNDK